MAGEKDIFGQADGLMRRGTGGTDTGAVPVLTELIEGGTKAGREPSSDLAREVFTRVMAEVEGRLAADLERRLSEHLAPQLHAAVAAAIRDLHPQLANAISDAVARALESRHLK